MAKEIIKHGPQAKKYITTCHHCQCVFSFQWEDVCKRESFRNETYMSVTCPNCDSMCTQCLEDAETVKEPTFEIDWVNGIIRGTIDKETMDLVRERFPEWIKK